MDIIKSWLKNNGTRWFLSLLRAFVSAFLVTFTFLSGSTPTTDGAAMKTLIISSTIAGVSAILKASLELIDSCTKQIQKNTGGIALILSKEEMSKEKDVAPYELK